MTLEAGTTVRCGPVCLQTGGSARSGLLLMLGLSAVKENASSLCSRAARRWLKSSVTRGHWVLLLLLVFVLGGVRMLGNSSCNGLPHASVAAAMAMCVASDFGACTLVDCVDMCNQ